MATRADVLKLGDTEVSRCVARRIARHGYAELAAVVGDLSPGLLTTMQRFHVRPLDLPVLKGLQATQGDVDTRLRCFFSVYPLATIAEAEEFLLPLLREKHGVVTQFSSLGFGVLCQSAAAHAFLTIADGNIEPDSVTSAELLLELQTLMTRRRGERVTGWQDVFDAVAERRHVPVESLALPRLEGRPAHTSHRLSIAFHIESIGKAERKAKELSAAALSKLQTRLYDDAIAAGQDAALIEAQADAERDLHELVSRLRSADSLLSVLATANPPPSRAFLRNAQESLSAHVFVAAFEDALLASLHRADSRTGNLLMSATATALLHLYAAAFVVARRRVIAPIAQGDVGDSVLAAATTDFLALPPNGEDSSSSSGGRATPSLATATLSHDDILAALRPVVARVLLMDARAVALELVDAELSRDLHLPSFGSLLMGTVEDFIVASSTAAPSGRGRSSGDIGDLTAIPRVPLVALAAAARETSGSSRNNTRDREDELVAAVSYIHGRLPHGSDFEQQQQHGSGENIVDSTAWDEAVSLVGELSRRGCVQLGDGAALPTAATSRVQAALAVHFNAPATAACGAESAPPGPGYERALQRLLTEANASLSAEDSELFDGADAVVARGAAVSVATARMAGFDAFASVTAAVPSCNRLGSPCELLAGVPLLGSVGAWLSWDVVYHSQFGSLAVFLRSPAAVVACSSADVRVLEEPRGTFLRIAGPRELDADPTAIRALQRGDAPTAASILTALIAFPGPGAQTAARFASLMTAFRSVFPAEQRDGDGEAAGASDLDYYDGEVANADTQREAALLLCLDVLALVPSCVRVPLGVFVVLPALSAVGVRPAALLMLLQAAPDSRASVGGARRWASTSAQRNALLVVAAAAVARPSVGQSLDGTLLAQVGALSNDEREALTDLCQDLVDAQRSTGVGGTGAAVAVPALPSLVLSEFRTEGNESGDAVAAAGTAAATSPRHLSTPVESSSVAWSAPPLSSATGALVIADDIAATPFQSHEAARAYIDAMHTGYVALRQMISEQGTANPLTATNTRFMLSAVASTQQLAGPLYRDASHFLFELLQNADDNRYNPSSDEPPTLSFELGAPAAPSAVELRGALTRPLPSVLLMRNNEVGFSPRDLNSLCSTATSSKTGAGSIGKKGIGFKSVFAVSDRPSVHSGWAHFAFDRREPPRGLGPAGMMVPQWDADEETGTVPVAGTQILLPLRTDGHRAMDLRTGLSDGLLRLAKRPENLLFLRQLRRINITVPLSDSAPSGGSNWGPLQHVVRLSRKPDERLQLASCADGVSAVIAAVEVTTSGGSGGVASSPELKAVTVEVREWLVCTATLPLIDGPVREVPLATSNDAPSQLQLAFPVDAAIFAAAAGSAAPPVTQFVFAFLPVLDYGLRFVLQADWVLATSRETVLEDDAWNQWVCTTVLPRAFAASLSAFKVLAARATRMTAGAAGGAPSSSSSSLPADTDDAGTAARVAVGIAAARAFLSFLPHPSRVAQWPLFHSAATATVALLRKTPCLPAHDGTWVRPDAALRPPRMAAPLPQLGGARAGGPVPSLFDAFHACGLTVADVEAACALTLTPAHLVLADDVWAALQVRAWDLRLAAPVLARSVELAAAVVPGLLGSRNQEELAAELFVARCQLLRVACGGDIKGVQLRSALQGLRFVPLESGRLVALSAGDAPVAGYFEPRADAPPGVSSADSAAVAMASSLGEELQPLLLSSVVRRFASAPWLRTLLCEMGVAPLSTESILRQTVLPRLRACRVVRTAAPSSTDCERAADTLLATELNACLRVASEAHATIVSASGHGANAALLADVCAAAVFMTEDGRAVRLQPPATAAEAAAGLASAAAAAAAVAAVEVDALQSGVPELQSKYLPVTPVPFLHVRAAPGDSGNITADAVAAREGLAHLGNVLGATAWPIVASLAHAPSSSESSGSRTTTALRGAHHSEASAAAAHRGDVAWSAFLAAAGVCGGFTGLPLLQHDHPALHRRPNAQQQQQQKLVPSQTSYTAPSGGRGGGGGQSASAPCFELDVLVDRACAAFTSGNGFESKDNSAENAAVAARSLEVAAAAAQLAAIYAALAACTDPAAVGTHPSLLRLRDTPWLPSARWGGQLFTTYQLFAPLATVKSSLGNRARYAPSLPAALLCGLSAHDACSHRMEVSFPHALGVCTHVDASIVAELLFALSTGCSKGTEQHPGLLLPIELHASDVLPNISVWSAATEFPLVLTAEDDVAFDGKVLPLLELSRDVAAAGAAGNEQFGGLLLAGASLVACDEGLLARAYALIWADASLAHTVPLFSRFAFDYKLSAVGGTVLYVGTFKGSGSRALVLDDGVVGLLRHVGVHSAELMPIYSGCPPALRTELSNATTLRDAWRAAMARVQSGRYVAVLERLGYTAPRVQPPLQLAALLLLKIKGAMLAALFQDGIGRGPADDVELLLPAQHLVPPGAPAVWLAVGEADCAAPAARPPEPLQLLRVSTSPRLHSDEAATAAPVLLLGTHAERIATMRTRYGALEPRVREVTRIDSMWVVEVPGASTAEGREADAFLHLVSRLGAVDVAKPLQELPVLPYSAVFDARFEDSYRYAWAWLLSLTQRFLASHLPDEYTRCCTRGLGPALRRMGVTVAPSGQLTVAFALAVPTFPHGVVVSEESCAARCVPKFDDVRPDYIAECSLFIDRDALDDCGTWFRAVIDCVSADVKAGASSSGPGKTLAKQLGQLQEHAAALARALGRYDDPAEVLGDLRLDELPPTEELWYAAGDLSLQSVRDVPQAALSATSAALAALAASTARVHIDDSSGLELGAAVDDIAMDRLAAIGTAEHQRMQARREAAAAAARDAPRPEGRIDGRPPHQPHDPLETLMLPHGASGGGAVRGTADGVAFFGAAAETSASSLASVLQGGANQSNWGSGEGVRSSDDGEALPRAARGAGGERPTEGDNGDGRAPGAHLRRASDGGPAAHDGDAPAAGLATPAAGATVAHAGDAPASVARDATDISWAMRSGIAHQVDISEGAYAATAFLDVATAVRGVAVTPLLLQYIAAARGGEELLGGDDTPAELESHPRATDRAAASTAAAVAVGRVGEELVAIELERQLARQHGNDRESDVRALAVYWLNRHAEKGHPFDIVVAPAGAVDPLAEALRFIEVKTTSRLPAQFLISAAEVAFAFNRRAAAELWLVTLADRMRAHIVAVPDPVAHMNRATPQGTGQDGVVGTYTSLCLAVTVDPRGAE